MKQRIALSLGQKIGVGAARALLPRGAREIEEHLANHALWRAKPSFQIMPIFAGDERLLVVSPHPDDEVLGCGGLIQNALRAGAHVEIAFLTSGDGSRTTQIALAARRPFGGKQSLFQIAQTRQGEALQAAKTLGVAPENVHFLGFPDGVCWKMWETPKQVWKSPTTGFDAVPYVDAFRTGAPYSRESLLETLAVLLNHSRPTQVFTTDGDDTHLDHKAAYCFVREALGRQQSEIGLWRFLVHYGIWPVPNGAHTGEKIAPPARLWHQRDWRELVLDEEQIRIKKMALNCHQTQMASTPRYLSAFVRTNELFSPVSLEPMLVDTVPGDLR